MEISFKRTPVDSPSKNVKGYIPQLPPKSSFFKKINAIYTDGICKALEKYESTSYIDYTESTVGNLSVFEFTVIYNEKRIRFSHVYDGIFPWRISKKEREKVKKTGATPKQMWTYSICGLTDISIEEDDEFIDLEEDDE